MPYFEFLRLLDFIPSIRYYDDRAVPTLSLLLQGFLFSFYLSEPLFGYIARYLVFVHENGKIYKVKQISVFGHLPPYIIVPSLTFYL
jgi:hypothetical protein